MLWKKATAKPCNGNLRFDRFLELMPGLQDSYTGAYGKGNTKLYPDWKTHSSILNYESERLVLIGQIFNSLGNHEGTLADSLGHSYKAKGWNTLQNLNFSKISLDSLEVME